MRRLMLALLFFIIWQTTLGQAPDTLWTQTFGGSYEDYGFCVQPTSDSGYIIAGWTDSTGATHYDVYLIKTDSLGNEIWSNSFGGEETECAESVAQTSDGGFIIAGSTSSFSAGVWDVYLIKTDSLGNEQWSRTYGGNGADMGSFVQQTSDGGYIITGFTTGAMEDVWLIKTDGGGNPQWQHTYGGWYDERGDCVQQTSDGGYIITGRTFSYGAGEYDVYLVKTDSMGVMQWQWTYGGASYDYGYFVQQTADGGYIISGQTNSFGAVNSDIYLIKTDANGIEQWSRGFGGNMEDYGWCVRPTMEGGYIVAGNISFQDILIKTNESGDEIWSQSYGGKMNRSVCQLADGGYIATGDIVIGVYTDIHLIRLAPENADPNVSISMTPINPPIIIPATGGTFRFNISITNNDSLPRTTDVWIKVILPNGSVYGPLTNISGISLSAGASLTRIRAQYIPITGPEGLYYYIGYTGDYPGIIYDSSYFNFMKVCDVDVTGEAEDWHNIGEAFTGEEIVSAKPLTEPAEIDFFYCSPNPFNNSTTITFSLPAPGKIKLAVYDILGRKIQELETEYYGMGKHTVVWNAEGQSSGVYFMRLTENGGRSSVRKAVLMK